MKNNRFFVSKKIIEYNTGKEDVVRKIQALIDGDVKSYELSIGVYSRYDGYVNDDGFVLYPKSNRSIYDGDEFVIALSSVMSFWSALSYVRFRSMFCFIAAIIVWLICYYGFSYKKENCINWIRELVEGHIR